MISRIASEGFGVVITTGGVGAEDKDKTIEALRRACRSDAEKVANVRRAKALIEFRSETDGFWAYFCRINFFSDFQHSRVGSQNTDKGRKREMEVWSKNDRLHGSPGCHS